MKAFRDTTENQFTKDHTIFLVYNDNKIKSYFAYSTISYKIEEHSFCRLNLRNNKDINTSNLVEISLEVYLDLYKQLCNQEINFISLFK